ncbi:MAG: GtrA family protein [Patescibacteria group bacterium]
MKTHLLRLYHSRLVRTLFVGAIAVVVQTSIFEAAAVWLGLVSPSTAVLLGGECGILTNFFINNRISFADRRAEGVLLNRLLRFHLVVAGSVFIQWLFVFGAEHWSSSLLVLHAAYAAGIVIGFVWNYTWYTLWVWRHHEAL